MESMLLSARHPDIARPRVALADDDDLHSEVVATWLDLHGFDVVRFATGDALLEWAQGEGASAPVAAVLLDVEMPGRDGFAIYSELRRLQAFTPIPVLLVSGMSPDKLRALADAVTAPSMPKDGDLLPRLTEWLSRSACLAA